MGTCDGQRKRDRERVKREAVWTPSPVPEGREQTARGPKACLLLC